MSGLRRCPHCGAQIVPFRNAAGKLTCPTCLNTGRAQATPAATPAATPPAARVASPAFPAYPAYAPPAYPPPAYAPPTYPGTAYPHAGYPAPYGQPYGAPTGQKAPGATLAMVMGILALVSLLLGPLAFLSVVFAILALVFGYRARSKIRASQGRLAGSGQATAGRVMGWVWVGLLPLAAVVFILVNNLAGAGQVVADRDLSLQPDQTYRYTFEVLVDQADVTYTVHDGSGHSDSVSMFSSDAAGHTTSSDFAGKTSYGGDVKETVRLAKGMYTIRIGCGASTSCDLHFRLSMTQA